VRQVRPENLQLLFLRAQVLRHVLPATFCHYGPGESGAIFESEFEDFNIGVVVGGLAVACLGQQVASFLALHPGV